MTLTRPGAAHTPAGSAPQQVGAAGGRPHPGGVGPEAGGEGRVGGPGRLIVGHGATTTVLDRPAPGPFRSSVAAPPLASALAPLLARSRSLRCSLAVGSVAPCDARPLV